MRLGTLAALLVGLAVLAASLTTAGVLWTCLTEYGVAARALVAAVAALGTGAAAVAFALLRRRCRSCRQGLAAILLLAVLVLPPAGCMLYPGRITYARFGLTVYNLLPVPFLDVTVSAQGRLWFRDKTHWVSIDEVQGLLSPGVEVLVIGTGWEGAVRVDPAVAAPEGVEVRALPAPEALALYNQYRAHGRRVALIAHSTC